MEEQHHDDQSHYEISLTAGQAFTAFVLLLLSLAASFAFGLMLGKGQADERLVVQKEQPVVTEASIVPKKNQGDIVELTVADDEDFVETKTAPAAVATGTTETISAVVEEAETATATAAPEPVAAATPAPAESGGKPPHSIAAVPHFAQLLSTGDQKAAEALAAKLIDGGFNTAYVERGVATEKGPVYRVRVKFASEADARAAEPKLRGFSKDVWITAR